MAEIVTLTKPNSTDIIYPQTRDTAVYNTQGDPISNVYAPINSPNLTGTPTAPTATVGTKTTQIATTKFVDNAINNIKPADIGAQVALSGSQGQVVGFDNSGKPVAQNLPTGVTSVNGQTGEVILDIFHVGTTAPSNTKLLWIDTANGLKYHNGTTWVTVPVAYN